MWATIIRELASAGLDLAAIANAVERIESAVSTGRPVDSTIEKRREWDRNRQAARRAAEREVRVASAESTGLSGGQVDTKEKSPIPPKENTTPKDTNQRARESGSRGTRLSPDFSPLPSIMELGRGRGLSDADLTDQLERFRDWANAATGQIGVKRDWQAAFRNWIKRAADDKRKTQGRYISRQSPGDALRDAFGAVKSHLSNRQDVGHRQRDGSGEDGGLFGRRDGPEPPDRP